MTTPSTTSRSIRIIGYACALCAGVACGTTGTLSTALSAQGAPITGICFWRLLIGLVPILVYGLLHRDLFRIDLRGWLLVGMGGGALVALFELASQFAISGTGVAG